MITHTYKISKDYIISMITPFLSLTILFLIFRSLTRQVSGSSGGMYDEMNMILKDNVKSFNKINSKVKFKDVAGLKEAK